MKKEHQTQEEVKGSDQKDKSTTLHQKWGEAQANYILTGNPDYLKKFGASDPVQKIIPDP